MHIEDDLAGLPPASGVMPAIGLTIVTSPEWSPRRGIVLAQKVYKHGVVIAQGGQA